MAAPSEDASGLISAWIIAHCCWLVLLVLDSFVCRTVLFGRQAEQQETQRTWAKALHQFAQGRWNGHLLQMQHWEMACLLF
eukprot:m.335221 g.335221  ORF g.335221 m.335221 type:complete len:81 (+) comp20524_c1_seq9:987-1229(+)